MKFKRRETWVSTADNAGYQPDDIIKKYCLKCEGFGYPYQELGERLYKPEELVNGQLPSDHEKWLSCYRCGALVPVQHGKQEGRITGFVEVPGQGDSLEPMAEHFINPRRKKKEQNTRQSALQNIEDDPDVKRLTSGSGSELRGYTDSS